MRVAILGPYGKIGSVNSIVMKLSRYLSSEYDVETHIITHHSEIGYDHSDTNLYIHNIKLYNPAFLSLSVRSIKNIIIKINPDIMHLFTTLIPYFKAAISFNYPTVLSLFGLIREVSKFRGLPKSSYNIINLFSERYILSKISNIVVESNKNKKFLSHFLNNKNIFVIPSGIDLDDIESKLSLLNNNYSEIDIFYIGRLSKEKGIDILIKSISELVQYTPNIKVVISGDGPQKNDLITLTRKLKLRDNIKFTGFISELDKFMYYQACKVVVIPSRWDFSPLTVAEAMACRKPIIASDSINSDFVINGKTGYIFKSEDFRELARKIFILLKDKKKRNKFGKNAYKLVRNYDWKRVAQKYLKLYMSISTKD